MRKRMSRVSATLMILFGSIGLFIGFAASPASAAFSGECTASDASSGTCVIDEPEGQNSDTHGTATYAIEDDTITFDFSPVQNITSMQVCLTVAEGDNPYVPTDANTCAGTHGDPVYQGDYVDPFSFDLTTLDGYDSGDNVFFAIHFVQTGMTTYITGGGVSGTDTECTPSTENNQCTPCDEGTEADGLGNCDEPDCEPTTDNNQCTPCTEGEADGQGNCVEDNNECVPDEANNQCTPCEEGFDADGAGNCNEVLGVDVDNPDNPKPDVEGTDVAPAELPRTGITAMTGLFMILSGGLLFLGSASMMSSLALQGRRED